MKSKNKIVVLVIIVLVLAACVGIIIYNNSDSVRLNRQLELGQKYLTETDFEQAIVAYNEAIQIDPMNIEAYLGMAEAYLCMDDYESALEILHKGYEKTGNDNNIKKFIDICKDSALHVYEQKDYVTALYYLDGIILMDAMEQEMYDLLDSVLESYIDILLTEEKYDEIKVLIEKYKDLNLNINFEDILMRIENITIDEEIFRAISIIFDNHTLDGKRLIEWTKEDTRNLVLSLHDLGLVFVPVNLMCGNGYWSEDDTSRLNAGIRDSDIDINWQQYYDSNDRSNLNISVDLYGEPTWINNEVVLNLGLDERINSYLGRNIEDVLNEIHPNIKKNVDIYPVELDRGNSDFCTDKWAMFSGKGSYDDDFCCIIQSIGTPCGKYSVNNMEASFIHLNFYYNVEGTINRIYFSFRTEI